MKLGASLLLVLMAAACSAKSSSGGSSSSSQPGDGGTCHYPASVQVGTDASASGCFAHPPGTICQVSNGASGTQTCSSICSASDYEMTCANTSAEPAPSLGCQVIPIPTPSNVLFYCCPCAE